MAVFELVHAQHVRRSMDALEVEFLGRHELRYTKGILKRVLFIETYVANDLAPDGCYVHFDKELTFEQIEQIKADLNDAAIPLRTKFHYN